MIICINTDGATAGKFCTQLKNEKKNGILMIIDYSLYSIYIYYLYSRHSVASREGTFFKKTLLNKKKIKKMKTINKTKDNRKTISKNSKNLKNIIMKSKTKINYSIILLL